MPFIGVQPKEWHCALLLYWGKMVDLAYPVLIPQYGAFAKRFLRVPVVLCDFHFHPPPNLDSPPHALHHHYSVKGNVVLCRQTSIGSGRRPWEPGRAGNVMGRKRIWVRAWIWKHDSREGFQPTGQSSRSRMWMGGLWAMVGPTVWLPCQHKP